MFDDRRVRREAGAVLFGFTGFFTIFVASKSGGGAVNIGMTFEQLRSTWMSKPRRYALRDE